MEINYITLVIIGLILILAIVFMIRKNQKQQKKFEREENDPAQIPAEHGKDKV